MPLWLTFVLLFVFSMAAQPCIYPTGWKRARQASRPNPLRQLRVSTGQL